ncbi:ABC transporter substrate-binding protein [Pseudomonas fragi]|nr:ABC transporter substrate-binding protein [uncultured Pseudomonas sp.]AMB80089.1 ABC transporter substrate-binding protein [Pseudomonas fragi]
MPITRRRALTGLALLPVALCGLPVVRAGDPTLPKVDIVSFEPALTESLLGLGVAPRAVVNAGYYREFVSSPELPGDVLDLGPSIEPNLEYLQRLAPELIIGTSWQLEGTLLSRIAPLRSFDIYSANAQPYRNAGQVVLELGALVNRRAEAQALLEQTDRLLEQLRVRLAPVSQRPVYIARLNPDGRHLLLFGAKGMYQAVLERLGLRNAYQGRTNAWGGSPAVGIETLLEQPDASLLYYTNPREALAAQRRLDNSPIWRALPMIREGRALGLPRFYPSGGLLTAQRLALSITEQLLAMESNRA